MCDIVSCRRSNSGYAFRCQLKLNVCALTKSRQARHWKGRNAGGKLPASVFAPTRNHEDTETYVSPGASLMCFRGASLYIIYSFVRPGDPYSRLSPDIKSSTQVEVHIGCRSIATKGFLNCGGHSLQLFGTRFTGKNRARGKPHASVRRHLGSLRASSLSVQCCWAAAHASPSADLHAT